MQTSSVRLPTWYRAVAVLVGIISIGAAFVVLIDPALGLATLVLILAFALLIIGIDRIVAGVTGHPFGWMPGGLPAIVSGGPAPGTSQNPPSGPPPR
jgi:uncharacterized membrane protein HdeD (DUF308 family)